MRYLLKPIFDLLTGDLVLLGDVINNYIALGIVGLIAFFVAFRATGSLYDMGLITGRSTGSLVHWTIRLIVFAFLFWVLSLIVWIIAVLKSISIWAWFGAITIIVILATARHSYVQKRSVQNGK